MRRWIALLLGLTMALSLAGCGKTGDIATEGAAVALYYEVRDAEQLGTQEAIASETRDLNVLSLRDLVDLYLAGPRSEDLVSPFPPGMEVLGIQYVDDILTLKMSGEFYTLTGVELSVASCCLTETVCGFTGRDALVLVDETESIRMEFHPGQFQLSGGLGEDDTETFTVYFPDSQYRYLIAETRDATLSRNETEEAYLLRKLREGPESSQLKPVLPQGTDVLGVRTEDGVCTVNLSYSFWENRPEDNYQNFMTIYGVTNTLTGLENVDAVRFLVEGTPLESYGFLPLEEPVSRYSDCIGPIHTASGEVDVDLYVLRMDGGTFAMPCRVRQIISQPLAQAVTETLLRYEPPRGCYNPIPYGTELLSISVSGGVCYVDLSERFIPQEDTEQAERDAVWSLVASLTALSEIHAVVLTVAGDSAGLNYVDISEPLTAQSFE